MNFLNAMLLGGGLAFSVPLLIHLLRREKFQRVDWGAMRWLEAVPQSSSRMPQWSTLLLLLNRIAIPILLAVALARPVLTAFSSSRASASASVAVVIDNSLSMSASSSGGTVLQQAKQLIDKVLEEESENGGISDVAVFTTTSEEPLVDTTFDVAAARDKIRQLAFLHHRGKPAAAIRAAVQRLQESDSLHRRLLIVSDYQTSTWRDAEKDITTILGSFEDEVGVTLLAPPQNEPLGNTSVHLDNPPVLHRIGEPLRIKVIVKGLKDSEAAQVALSIDGTLFRRESIAGQSSRDVATEFACKFTNAGTHTISVSLDSDLGPACNCVVDDDIVHHVVQVGQPQEVVLISDQSNPAAEFLAAALQPFTEGSLQANRFRVRHLLPGEITEGRLRPACAVVALPESPLNESAQSALAQFIAAGGGLIAIPTDKIDWWNRFAIDKDPVLPLQYTIPTADTISSLSLPSRLPSEIESLRRTLAATLTRTQITQSSILQARSSMHERPHTLLLGASGPLIAMQKVGKGRVVQFAFSPQPSWTNLQLQPAFVPLFQEIVAVASSSKSPQLSWFSGDPVPSHLVDRINDATPINRSDAVASIKSSARGALDYAGLYRLPSKSSSSGDTGETFAVKIHPDECLVERLSPSDIDGFAAAVGATRARSANDFAQMQAELRNGKDVWRWFLFAVICLLVSEIWLSGQITRGGQ